MMISLMIPKVRTARLPELNICEMDLILYQRQFGGITSRLPIMGRTNINKTIRYGKT